MEKKEELVATCADFNATSVQVLLCKDDDYLCIRTNGKVIYIYILVKFKMLQTHKGGEGKEILI